MKRELYISKNIKYLLKNIDIENIYQGIGYIFSIIILFGILNWVSYYTNLHIFDSIIFKACGVISIMFIIFCIIYTIVYVCSSLVENIYNLFFVDMSE